LPQEDLDLGDAKSLLRFKDECDEIDNLALLIIDTQALATPGADENSPTEMGNIYSGVKTLAEMLKCCILVLHHTPVSAQKGEPRARGTGAILAACDFEMGIVNIKKATKSLPARAGIKFQKNKFGPVPPDPFNFALQIVDLGYTDEDGDEVSNAWAAPDNTTKADEIRDMEGETDADRARRLIAPGEELSWSAVCTRLFATRNESAVRRYNSLVNDLKVLEYLPQSDNVRLRTSGTSSL